MAKEKASQESVQQERNQGERQSQPMQQYGREGGGQRGISRRDPFGVSSAMISPFSLMSSFADEVDRLFEDFGFGRRSLAPFGRRDLWPTEFGEMSRQIWSPQIEVFEREGQIIVRADLPGLKKEDVKIDIADDSLTIQGERRQEREEDREGFYRSERTYGSFYRTIRLPEGVNADEARASFRDGVLEISIPVPERAQRRRRIEIGEEAAQTQAQPRAGAQTTSK
jgi:HSP20 family protein